MFSKNTHPVISFVVIAAYVLNLALVAGGAVTCNSPKGELRFELACDHDHCGSVVESHHVHDESHDCSCSSCPCEDSPLGIATTPMLKDNELALTLANGHQCVLWYAAPATPPILSIPSASRERAPPGVDQTLRRIRTTVLVV